MSPAPKEARCLTCNYPLRDLPENRCPECGRVFDPDDPKSMRLGRTPGPIARYLLRQTDWPTLLLAVAAAVALYLISGPPRLVPPRLTDTLYYLDRRHWDDYAHTSADKAYAVAVAIWLLLLVFCLLRFLMRCTARRRYAQGSTAPARLMLRRATFGFSLFFSICIVLFGWPLRVTRSWIAGNNPTNRSLSLSFPLNLPNEDQLIALKSVVNSHINLRDRIGALNLYVNCFKNDAPVDLTTIAAQPGEAEFRVIAIHVLCLYHRSDSAALFQALLNDADPTIRAAAADGIDILRGTGLARPDYPWNVLPSQVIATPPIDVTDLLPQSFQINRAPLPRIAIDQRARDELEKMMTSAATYEEREAAARAIVNWPPREYDLRVAEWGVWLADSSGDLKLAQAILDEIPPFVHAIGDSLASLAGRYPFYAGKVTKPIVHLKTDHPIALDVEIYIRQGRPWFAYPKPDDLVLSRRAVLMPSPRAESKWHLPEQRQLLMQELDPLHYPVLPGMREGYPWLSPPHRYHFNVPNSGPNIPDPTSLGLRWQSVIVLPDCANWMQPPAIPDDRRFEWWAALRRVPSSYVSSRGESDRFLYYDGPTQAKPPLIAGLSGNTLALQVNAESALAKKPQIYEPIDETPLLKQRETAFSNHREAFFIRVTGGRPSAIRFTIPDEDRRITKALPAELPIGADKAVSEFKRLLTDFGLTSEESDGLIAAWKTQFFQTDGQRLLLRLSGPDYDNLCPISIRPAPTTLVRLGLVLTEFK